MNSWIEIDKTLAGANVPEIKQASLSELIKKYLQLAGQDLETSNLFLLAVEQYFQRNPLSDEIKNFQDFFKLAFLFNRNNNEINRFFDASLGLRSLGNLTKFNQVVEEKMNNQFSQDMRIKGSFDYAHTQSHYSILLDIFNYLMPQKNEHFIDVGSGYGRVGLFMGLTFPDVYYTGLELVSERVDCSIKVSEKNHFKNVNYKVQDLLDKEFVMPAGEYYYFYDPLEEAGLLKLIEDLKAQHKLNSSEFKIVAMGGYDDKLIDYFSSQDWLEEIRLIEDKHFKQTGRIYQTITN